MHIYKGLDFDKWCSKHGVSDEVLSHAINELSQGLYEANLGGGVFKKRLPLGGKGKRGGARTLLAFKKDQKAIFIYAFAKNKQDNINAKELATLKKLATIYLKMSDEELNVTSKKGFLIKVI